MIKFKYEEFVFPRTIHWDGTIARDKELFIGNKYIYFFATLFSTSKRRWYCHINLFGKLIRFTVPNFTKIYYDYSPYYRR